MFDPEANLDLDQLRTRLAEMTDVGLRSLGESAAYMCSPEANLGTEPRPVFVAAWTRREQSGGDGSRNYEQSSTRADPVRPRGTS